MQIALSQLRANGFADAAAFDKAVADYVDLRVKHSQSVGEPRPVAHPMVEAAVQRYLPPDDLMPGEEAAERFAPEYEIIDDTPPPPPPPSLDDRKREMASAVAMAAIRAGDAAWPQLTRRMMTAKAMAAYLVPQANRSTEQTADVVALETAQSKLSEIDLHLAGLEMQIHGLTEEIIDGWKPADFPV